MIFSEVEELAATVCPEEVIDSFLLNCLESRDRCKKFKYSDDNKVIAAQPDAAVDMWYYCQNVFCKNGVNLSEVFDLVHEANMKKKDPVLGSFIKRKSDGKIMKPRYWKPPDIEGEIKRQTKNGSWTKN